LISTLSVFKSNCEVKRLPLTYALLDVKDDILAVEILASSAVRDDILAVEILPSFALILLVIAVAELIKVVAVILFAVILEVLRVLMFATWAFAVATLIVLVLKLPPALVLSVTEVLLPVRYPTHPLPTLGSVKSLPNICTPLSARSS
jgi:hypothetical protein